MRPEFRAGIDALTKFIFERTRPKQLGSIVMTGPMFAGLTQSFLDAINAGAVPTIATSWQVLLRLKKLFVRLVTMFSLLLFCMLLTITRSRLDFKFCSIWD